jgi:hypothetical protein
MPDNVLDSETQETGVSKEHKAETVTISKAEFDRLGRERDEAKQSEKYWADRARPAATATQVDEEEQIEVSDLIPPKVTGKTDVDESIFNDPDKWLAAISKGPAAIKTLIKAEGFVNAAEVADIAAKVARRSIAVERTKIGTDNRLMTAFPELADNKSELFRATAEEYQELVEFDPDAKKSPATLFAAAKAAKTRLAAAKPRATDDDEEYGYDRAESSRQARVAGQDGSRNGRGALQEETDTLGPQARQIAKLMGISEDEMRTEKKKTDAMRRRR